MKNYVYWQSPDGSGDLGRHAPNALLAEIGKNCSINSDGHATWRNFQYANYSNAAYRSLVIKTPDGKDLNSNDTYELAFKSANELLIEMGGGKPIIAEELRLRINKKAGEFFNKRSDEYTFVSSLSISGYRNFPIIINNCVLNSANRRDFPYPVAATKYAHRSFLQNHMENSKYQILHSKIISFSVNEGFDTFVQSLSYLAGLWNFIATFKSNSITSYNYPAKKRISEVNIGPIHTVHGLDDENHSGYWFDPDYSHELELFNPRDGWEKLENQRASIETSISESPFKEELISLFIRYANALHHSDLNVTFLMLWGILEKITNTIGKNYDETIKRAVWFHEDKKIMKEFLNFARTRRNFFVHSAAPSDAPDRLCNLLKQFIDEHLRILCFNSNDLKNLGEYGDLLSMPHDPSTLRKMVRLTSIACSVHCDDELVDYVI